MHLHLALMGHALLRPSRGHPLDDPLDAPEWAGLWRVFAWRAQVSQWLRPRRDADPDPWSLPRDHGALDRTDRLCGQSNRSPHAP
jgi:hypothetical protein